MTGARGGVAGTGVQYRGTGGGFTPADRREGPFGGGGGGDGADGATGTHAGAGVDMNGTSTHAGAGVDMNATGAHAGAGVDMDGEGFATPC